MVLRGNERGPAADFDRQLFEFIAELTDEGQVLPLQQAVDFWGRQLVVRVVADGFAVIRSRGSADTTGGLGDANFVPGGEVSAVVHHLRKTSWDAPDSYVILAAPWAAVGPEDDADLIFRYAADDPDATSEIRKTHAERRDRWERNLASTS